MEGLWGTVRGIVGSTKGGETSIGIWLLQRVAEIFVVDGIVGTS